MTANRVLNSRRAPGVSEILPLPALLIPAGAVRTQILLGQGSPDVSRAEARARIEGFEFTDGNSEIARLNIFPELMAGVSMVLFDMRKRFRMKDNTKSSTLFTFLNRLLVIFIQFIF